jgi:hypothetical protein
MTMDPMAQDAPPAQEQAPAQDAAAPEMMDPESEAVAAMAAVALFGLLPQCASFTATQAEDSSITISCEMSDGSKAEYLISADAANVAIAEAAGAEAPSED